MSSHGRSDPGQGSGPPRYPGTFLLAFREAVAARNWQVKRWRGQMVECVDAEGHDHVLGLENLYRRARREERVEWPTLIREFLDTVDDAEVAEGLPTELAAVADQLLVRLGQPFQRTETGPRVWSQALGNTDLHLNLV